MPPDQVTIIGSEAAGVYLLGAGSQAVETAGYCREVALTVLAFLEERPDGVADRPLSGRPLDAYEAPVHTFDDVVVPPEATALTAVGDAEVRIRLVRRWEGTFRSVVSPHAWLAPDVVVGMGTTIAPGAIVNRFVRLGEHVLVNCGAVLSHDVQVDDFATISPGCAVAGGVRIGRGSFLGVGATVRDGVRIGDSVTVGAGAVVVSDVTSGSTVAGVPARPLRGRGET